MVSFQSEAYIGHVQLYTHQILYKVQILYSLKHDSCKSSSLDCKISFSFLNHDIRRALQPIPESI